MLSSKNLVEQLELTQTYQHVKWDTPPAIPKIIEFLDQQDMLVAGVIYMSPEDFAIEFLAQKEIKVFPGAVLLISDASDELPETLDNAGNLTVIGYLESLRYLYNRLSIYIGSLLEDDHQTCLSSIWSQIISNNTLTTSEIREKFRKLPELTEPFVQLGVVAFDNPENNHIPYIRVMHQIKAHIPNCCAAVYDKEIIIIITYKERRFDYPFELEGITGILEKYNAYMSLSNGTRELNMLKTLYILSRRIITLAREMDIAAAERVYTFERLGTYCAIDLCARGFNEIAGHDGIVYLAHPAVVALTRYDRNHNDNLRDVLYFYLINDRSITNTASALYMHRNTVLNKVRKINQILGLDLDDRHLRQRLLFSCQLIHYFEDITKKGLKL